MMFRPAILLAALAVSVSACGFQPVHAPRAASNAGPISIQQIDGRAGHELRKALLLETASGLPGAEGGGELIVDLKEEVIRQGFRPDGVAFRTSVRLTASYVADLGDTAISGTQSAEVNINLPDGPYAELALSNDATERAATTLARRMFDDMVLKLDAPN